jgi:hypothetical protein
LAITNSKKRGFYKGISKGLRFLTYTYAEAGNHTKALEVALEKVAFEEDRKNGIELIHAYNSLVYIYASTNKTPKALECSLCFEYMAHLNIFGCKLPLWKKQYIGIRLFISYFSKGLT